MKGFNIVFSSVDYLKRGTSNFVRWSLINLGEGSDLPLAKNGWYLLVLGDKMRLKSFDFLLFAKLPNWHEEWCMLWWLPSSIQFFEGECNAFTFYYVYFDGWEGKKSPSFCRKNYKWGFTGFASTRKIPKKIQCNFCSWP